MSESQTGPAVDPQLHADAVEGEVSRRVFHQLSMAVLSGLMAGSIVGCSGEEGGGGGDGSGGGDGTGGGNGTGGGGGHGGGTGGSGAEGAGTGGEATTGAAEGEPFSWVTADKHVCRGLNSCENKGASGENACAGQGTCATAAANSCHGQNACKGQGGCGEHPGENACRGQGGCHVPLHEGAMWDSARARFEEAMTAAGKEFGEAPAAM